MKVVNNLFDSITDIERSGDHVENMAGYLQHIKDMNENISEDAIEELRNMNNIVRAAFESAICAIEFDDTKEAKKHYLMQKMYIVQERSSERDIFRE